MPETSRSIECGVCGFPIEEPFDLEASKRHPCPKCGSLKRHIPISIGGNISFHKKLKIQARSSGGGKPRFEAIEGDDLNRKTGIWMKLHRVFDRANNWYHEKIIDPRTDEVVHECSEPLDEHIGHGATRTEQDMKSEDAK
jgi:hypothetical protein